MIEGTLTLLRSGVKGVMVSGDDDIRCGVVIDGKSIFHPSGVNQEMSDGAD